MSETASTAAEAPPASQPSATSPRLQISALMLSVAILVIGNGLQGTLVGVRAGLEGMSQEVIGLVMSAYFLGFAIGSVLSPRLINRVGHIRTFAALASITSAVALAFIIVITPAAWIVLRMLHGACYAGLVIVAESWLNAATDRNRRGRVLAIYNIVLMAAWISSQPLLTVAAPSGFLLFCVVSICLSLALVPITLGRVTVPGVVTATRASLGRLYAISPIGVATVFAIGVCTSAFWGMGAPLAHAIGFTDSQIAAFMAVTMLGGLTLQWPLGWLSDYLDRRLVIVGACLTAGVFALLIAETIGDGLPRILAFCFVYGACSFPLYSLCVAHVNDHVDLNELVAVASGLILVFGIGSILGPVVGSVVMGQIGPAGLFVFTGVVLFAAAGYGFVRIIRQAPVPASVKEIFVAVPKTTHASLRLHKHGAADAKGKTAPS